MLAALTFLRLELGKERRDRPGSDQVAAKVEQHSEPPQDIRHDSVKTPAKECARATPLPGIAVAQRDAPGREWILTTRTKRKAVNQ